MFIAGRSPFKYKEIFSSHSHREIDERLGDFVNNAQGSIGSTLVNLAFGTFILF